jgi:hypothetical protein
MLIQIPEACPQVRRGQRAESGEHMQSMEARERRWGTVEQARQERWRGPVPPLK